jgi:hypothetical protein
MAKDKRTLSTKIPKDLRKDDFDNSLGIPFSDFKKLFFQSCKNKEELSAWIEIFFGFKVPYQTVSRYSTSNMLDFIWYIYECFMYGDGGKSLLLVTNRGGGKTLTAAVLEILHMFHGKGGSIHVGASSKISKRAYEYVRNFVQRNSIILDPLQRKDTMEKSDFILDDKTSVSIEVLGCTFKELNGPHQPLIVMDELDIITKEQLGAYAQISGIPVKHPISKKLPIDLGISTRKSRAGLVHKQMESALVDGRIVHIWNKIDMMERCPDERSGTQIVSAWNCQKTMKLISEENFLNLSETQKIDFTKVECFEGCLVCPLGSVCLGDSKKQNSTSFLTCSFKEVTNLLKNGIDFFLSEQMCLLPSLEGVVFNRFEKHKHVITINQMCSKITGINYDYEVTHQELVSEIKRMGLSIYGGIDWGWNSPNVLVVCAIDLQKEEVYILDTFFTPQFTNHQDFINAIKNTFQPYYNIEQYFPDIADGSSIDLLEKAGLRVYRKINKNIGLGVQIIKNLLIEAGTERSKIFLLKDKNIFLERELESYRYETDSSGQIVEGKFNDSNNHSIDSLRYILTHFLSKQRGSFSCGFEDRVKFLQTPVDVTPTDEVNGIKGTWEKGVFYPERKIGNFSVW